jgi:hypothetical protein
MKNERAKLQGQNYKGKITRAKLQGQNYKGKNYCFFTGKVTHALQSSKCHFLQQLSYEKIW